MSPFLNSNADVRHYVRDEEVVGEGEVAENYHVVVNGVFRSVKLTVDGRRQIFSFYMRGDLCSLASGDAYELTIEAVDAGSKATFARPACRARMNRDPHFNSAVFDRATGALALAVDRMSIIGLSSAEERLAWFLTTQGRRSSASADNPRVLEMAMTRRDVADYLGLTIETVSRAFTQLKKRRLIALATARRVEILNFDQLERIATLDRDATL